MKLTAATLKRLIKEQLQKLIKEQDNIATALANVGQEGRRSLQTYISARKRQAKRQGWDETDFEREWEKQQKSYNDALARERDWLRNNTPEGNWKKCLQMGCRETHTGEGGLKDAAHPYQQSDPIVAYQHMFGDEDSEGQTATQRRRSFSAAAGAKKCTYCPNPLSATTQRLKAYAAISNGWYNIIKGGKDPFAATKSVDATLSPTYGEPTFPQEPSSEPSTCPEGCPPGTVCTDRDPETLAKTGVYSCVSIKKLQTARAAATAAAAAASAPTPRSRKYSARVGRARRNGLTILKKAGFDGYQDFYDKLEETDLLSLLDPYGPDKKWGPRHSDALKQFQKDWDLATDEELAAQGAEATARDRTEREEIEAVAGAMETGRYEAVMDQAQELFKLMDGLTGFESKKKIRSIIDEAEKEGTLGTLYSAYDEVLQRAFKMGAADPEDGDLIQWLKDDSLPDSAKRVNAAVEKSAETGTPLGDRVYDALMKDFLREVQPRQGETFEEWGDRYSQALPVVKEKYKKITGKSETPKDMKYGKIIQGWLDSRGWDRSEYTGVLGREDTVGPAKEADSSQLREFSSFPKHQKLFEGWSRYLKS